MAAAAPHLPPQPLILLALRVEDDREMYDEYLRLAGFRAMVALDGADLREKARALRPHAIVVGQLLHPGGEQVCAALKAEPEVARIPRILIVSYTTRAAGDATLVRPVLPQALSSTLRLLIKKAGTVL